jgi:hypothetical protein
MAYIEDLRAFVEVAGQRSTFLPLERALPAARQPSLPAGALDDVPGNSAARALRLAG